MKLLLLLSPLMFFDSVHYCDSFRLNVMEYNYVFHGNYGMCVLNDLSLLSQVVFQPIGLVTSALRCMFQVAGEVMILSQYISVKWRAGISSRFWLQRLK